MRLSLVIGVVISLSSLAFAADAPAEPDWSLNATNIEACSCKMFCSCYFTGAPTPAPTPTAPAPGGSAGSAGHQHDNAYCRFNNAFKINSGHWGDTKLDGLKFWMAGDLGSDFSKGFDWAIITFEPEATPPQRDAVKAIIKHIFPGNWNSFSQGTDAKIDWSAEKDQATAKMDDGKVAEVRLKRNQGMTDDPITINNIRFWAAPRNDGFKVMQNEVQAYRVGDKAFETKKTNGFVVTIDMNSKDVASAPK
jgi:hypothetical protein